MIFFAKTQCSNPKRTFIWVTSIYNSIFSKAPDVVPGSGPGCGIVIINPVSLTASTGV